MARTQGSHSGITGPRVRAAALQLFARYGFAAVSMRQIAAEVGVQAGALYNYTPDKQTLLFSLLKGHMEELMVALGQVDWPATPVEQLEAFTRFHIRFHIKRPEMVFVSYMELRNLTPENFATVEALRKGYEDRLEAILRAGGAAGDMVISDTKLATLAIIAMLTGMHTWYRESGRLGPADLEQLYWGMVRGAVGA